MNIQNILIGILDFQIIPLFHCLNSFINSNTILNMNYIIAFDYLINLFIFYSFCRFFLSLVNISVKLPVCKHNKIIFSIFIIWIFWIIIKDKSFKQLIFFNFQIVFFFSQNLSKFSHFLLITICKNINIFNFWQFFKPIFIPESLNLFLREIFSLNKNAFFLQIFIPFSISFLTASVKQNKLFHFIVQQFFIFNNNRYIFRPQFIDKLNQFIIISRKQISKNLYFFHLFHRNLAINIKNSYTFQFITKKLESNRMFQVWWENIKNISTSAVLPLFFNQIWIFISIFHKKFHNFWKNIFFPNFKRKKLNFFKKYIQSNL